MLDEPQPTPKLLEQQPESAAIDEFPMHLMIEARPRPTKWCATKRPLRMLHETNRRAKALAMFADVYG